MVTMAMRGARTTKHMESTLRLPMFMSRVGFVDACHYIMWLTACSKSSIGQVRPYGWRVTEVRVWLVCLVLFVPAFLGLGMVIFAFQITSGCLYMFVPCVCRRTEYSRQISWVTHLEKSYLMSLDGEFRNPGIAVRRDLTSRNASAILNSKE
ncbi:uncharacterized protein B0H64DRAFT_382004 [Chaetomium fimeti]|uniref:Uncharacterized protein n=1 Tax=Chaetomium fimeti TaxID=1854472 RepID=A0AAE0HQG6_9PEZI|nr:hypothetical protein B0H64DRAFT_382004 [Chaetomium fimeti]